MGLGKGGLESIDRVPSKTTNPLRFSRYATLSQYFKLSMSFVTTFWRENWNKVGAKRLYYWNLSMKLKSGNSHLVT